MHINLRTISPISRDLFARFRGWRGRKNEKTTRNIETLLTLLAPQSLAQGNGAGITYSIGM
jgi:hypothetical protein